MRRRDVFRLLAVGGCGALTGCGIFRPSEELRFRLTVEVDTPEGLKSGSSVIEVRGVQNPGWVNPEGRGTRSSYKGEAVAVDLPDGQTLFALLRTQSGASNAADYPYLAFQDGLKASSDRLESMRMMRGWKGQVQPMPPTERVLGNGGHDIPALPLLVSFSDIRDPLSVEQVDPTALEKTFGPGIVLRRITVTITNDAVTSGIDKRLAWRSQIKDGMLNGLRSEDFRRPELAAHLSIFDFSTERPK